jgi:hypothetical protein
MYCEICQFQQKPDRRDLLVRHMETSEKDCRKGTIVWRENQFWVTTSPKSDEVNFDWEIPNHPVPPEPEITFPKTYRPNVTQVGGPAA